MDEMNVLRAWLADQRGRWTRIAADTGLSTKTLARIAHGQESVNLRTYTKLREAMKAASQLPEPVAA
jgi:hypothetical protein